MSDRFQLGCRVQVGHDDELIGVLAFRGTVKFAKGDWAGVVFDKQVESHWLVPGSNTMTLSLP